MVFFVPFWEGGNVYSWKEILRDGIEGDYDTMGLFDLPRKEKISKT